MREEIGKIGLEALQPERAALKDLQEMYVSLENFYRSLRVGGEDFCREYYTPILQRMIEENPTYIVRLSGKNVATVAFCGSPLVEIEGWSNMLCGAEGVRPMYLEGISVNPEVGNRGIEKTLFKAIEKAVLKGDLKPNFLRTAAIDWLKEFYERNGFNKVREQAFKGRYNLILFEKRVGE